MLGITLSHFQITAKLGEGGMGEVYRATDSKLGREVAIKILPEAVANDPARLARFEREARVLASLNHPHIAAIYSIESATSTGPPEARLASLSEGNATLGEPQAGHVGEGRAPSRDGGAPAKAGDQAVGRSQDERESSRAQPQPVPAERGDSPPRPVHFLVMELAEGEDLAVRIARGPLPVEDALPIALQMAEALEAAHERGIIHRDLKPANIKVDGEGQVKILDFGLAKALDPAAGSEGPDSAAGAQSPSVIPLSMSPTLTAQMTEAGIILGTAAYMSPEQAKGKSVDKRADIWAFGIVLFEMLTGRKLFAAESVPETLGAIFQQDIDLDELPPDTPRHVRRLLERCLERDPKLRLRDIGEARIILDSVGDPETEEVPDTAPHGSRSALSPALVALALLGVAAVSGWLGYRMRSSPQPAAPEVTEFSIRIDPARSGEPRGFDLSPDGRRLAWTDGSRLLVRDLDSREPRQILEENEMGQGFWSPDSQDMALEIDEQLWRLDVATGKRELICDLPELPKVPESHILAGAWREDDTIFFAAWRGGIYRVPARGGVPELIIPIDPEVDVDFHHILLLPDGESFALAAHYQEALTADPDSNSGFEIYRRGERSRLALPEKLQFMLPVGYARDRILVTSFGEGPSDLWGLHFDAATGELVAGEPELLISGGGYATVARDGTLAYLPETEEQGIVVLIGPDGQEVDRFGEPQPDLSFPTLSPDGQRLAMVSQFTELWVQDLERGTRTRLLRDEEGVADPQWTPDSRTIYYSTQNSAKLRRIRADPGAEPETVDENAFRSFLAPDGSGLLINQGGFQLEKAGGLHWAPLDTEGRLGSSRQILGGFEISGRMSPDGRLIAYRVREEGPGETFLATFPDAEQTIQLSSGGAFTPRWSVDGRSVYYFSGGQLKQVDVGIDEDGRLRASAEKPLFDLRQAGLTWYWDVTADGFLFVKKLDSDLPREIVVRQHAIAPIGATP